MIADERRRTVQLAYDALGASFGKWAERIEGDPWERFLDELVARLPTDGRVLDLGCGNGVKIARLAERFELVAVDFSEEQLRLARTRLSGATLVNGDFSKLDFADHSFDAVTALTGKPEITWFKAIQGRASSGLPGCAPGSHRGFRRMWPGIRAPSPPA